MTFAWVALGAASGAPLRYLVESAIKSRHDTVFPWGTLVVVNLVGCLILGFVVAGAARLPPAVQTGVGAGFCGALTTYSTFSHETLRLVEVGARFYAVVYVAGSLLGGLGAAGLGWTLGSWLVAIREVPTGMSTLRRPIGR
jgi:fluoride exporter